MPVIVHLKDGTSFETTEENIDRTERLMGDNIKRIDYPVNEMMDAVNALAAKQAALWNKSEDELKEEAELLAKTEADEKAKVKADEQKKIAEAAIAASKQKEEGKIPDNKSKPKGRPKAAAKK